MKYATVFFVTILLLAGCASKTVVVKTHPREIPPPAISQGQEVSSGNHVEQGKKFYLAGKYQQAIKHFTAAISRNPNNWEAHYYLGLSQQQTGRYDQAIHSLNNSLKYSPNDSMTRSLINFSLGISWEKEGYFARALELYSLTVQLSPGHADAKTAMERVKIKASVDKKTKRNPKAD